MTAAEQPFVDSWRRIQSTGYDLLKNSTSKALKSLDIFGTTYQIYTNANLSIYSGQACNAHCSFCVEELRPASRGKCLSTQKTVEQDDEPYFQDLSRCLTELSELHPTVSITGGEPSIDPRLPRTLKVINEFKPRSWSLTSNGSGLLSRYPWGSPVEAIAEAGITYLNLSIAHHDFDTNAKIMRFQDSLRSTQLQQVVSLMNQHATRVRLSCVLLKGYVDSIQKMVDYIEFADRNGVDNVIFRQLMGTDPATHARNHVVRYSDQHRVSLMPLLDNLSDHQGFSFVKQIMGYYYYVEVWKYKGIDVVFEAADLARLEQTKSLYPGVIFELVYHPNGKLASTWQPYDGVIS